MNIFKKSNKIYNLIMELETSAPGGPAGLNASNFEEMEAKLEEMFDKADNLMITQKKYHEAVSLIYLPLTLYRMLFIPKFLS